MDDKSHHNAETPHADRDLGTYDNIFRLYEEGKHRRYALLFSVNGGAFAVAGLFAKDETKKLLGNLSLQELAIGLAAFTATMVIDTMVFGQRMREAAGDDKKGRPFHGIFSLWGKGVLTFIGLLIATGWLLVV